MNHIFQTGENIIIQVPVVDEGELGAPLKSASYSVYDMNNESIIDETDLPMTDVIADDFEQYVLLNIEQNDKFDPKKAPTGSPRAYYRVIVTFTAESGFVHRHVEEFFIESAKVDLEPPINSFQTFGYLMSLATTRANMDCFFDATFDERLTSLLSAFQDICTAPLFYENEKGEQRDLIEDFQAGIDMPEELIRTMSMAQVVQSSYILGGSPIEARRQWGLVSGATGDSKQFYRNAKPISTPICAEAYQVMKQYVSYAKRISRS